MHQDTSQREFQLEDFEVENTQVCKGSQSTSLDRLLEDFSEVFQEPKALPPLRIHNHHINLKEESQPENLRPCKYLYVQKEEIEKIVNNMLVFGIIQPSNSLYAFPVLLVKKHDGS